jgi:hypoxanthine phosphoribosyltransferase
MMARFLTEQEAFDHYLAVAPEGHVYGYFFEQLGTRVLTVHVDYPPRRCELLDDLSVLRDARVLIIEDDVVSGVTLGLVVNALEKYEPRSLALYLGRRKDDQQVGSIMPEIERVFLAEDCLDSSMREHHESSFVEFFGPTKGESQG